MIGSVHRVPRLYAAASLKPASIYPYAYMIESRVPRLYAAASLKQLNRETVAFVPAEVFRGFMPRPH